MTKHIQERAKRLTLLLNMSCLSRKAFGNKYHIAVSNFQNWEGPRFGGLTEKAGTKIIEACRKEGVEANVEWLMYGSGTPPMVLYSPTQKDDQISNREPAYEHSSQQQTTSMEDNLYRSRHHTELAKIARELDMFRGHYGYDVLTTVVADDSMEPRYKKGDHVAGKRHLDISPLLNRECIVETAERKLLVCIPTAGSKKDLYNLTLCNTKKSEKEKAETAGKIRDAQIISAAPIIWIRRLETGSNAS